MNLAAIVGSLLGIGAILCGQWLEGGHLGQITQFTAALIVGGGTAAAVLVAHPWHEIQRALGQLSSIYFGESEELEPLIEEIVKVAAVARKEGMLALEPQRESIQNPQFRRAIKYVIDGFESQTVQEMLKTELDLSLERDERAAKVFESAGGYAPTIGILGAVLGLIHVMTMLNDPSKIGEGIAVAFVATLYGVALANLVLLPWGARLKRHAQERTLHLELVQVGIAGIQEGLNPHFLQEKLEIFLAERAK